MTPLYWALRLTAVLGVLVVAFYYHKFSSSPGVLFGAVSPNASVGEAANGIISAIFVAVAVILTFITPPFEGTE